MEADEANIWLTKGFGTPEGTMSSPDKELLLHLPATQLIASHDIQLGDRTSSWEDIPVGQGSVAKKNTLGSRRPTEDAPSSELLGQWL
jgi:hypothetical protein